MNSHWRATGRHSRQACDESRTVTPRRAESVVEAFPSLRRYARAVTGSADRGDRYVRQVLEVLLSAPDALVAGDDSKLQCFMLFHAVCRGLDPAKDAMPAAGVRWIDRQFAALVPVCREVLLLVYLEGFPISQAARIVGIHEGEARGHLILARLAFRKAAPRTWDIVRYLQVSTAT